MTLVLELPLHTVSEANTRSHHFERAARARKQRHGVQMALPVQLRREGITDLARPLVVTMTRLSRGELDDDNLRGALKAVRDGIADALGLASDRDPRVTWNYAQGKATKAKPFGVRIEIRARVLEEERPRAGTDG